jgi:hypothetical protein
MLIISLASKSQGYLMLNFFRVNMLPPPPWDGGSISCEDLDIAVKIYSKIVPPLGDRG